MHSYLFNHNNRLITSNNFEEALRRLKADECDVLYIHTGMQFGLPNLKLGRSGVLESLAQVLYGLNVSTLIMPSYTFSFCNDEIFNQESTPSLMGALNEFMRVKHKWHRSIDPLMSNILFGKEHGLISKISKNSVGVGSTFDLLSRSGLKVKFLFLGPRIHNCFTYMHYLESIKQVPYRYNYNFSGTIISEGKIYNDEYSLFIRDENVNAGAGARIYENIMIERGIAGFEYLGGGALTVVDLDKAQTNYLELLEVSPSFYIEEVFKNPVRSKSFHKRKMIAL